jgi:hypothetical protein
MTARSTLALKTRRRPRREVEKRIVDACAEGSMAANGPEVLSAESMELPKDPVIEAYKKDIDRTLIRENLKLTVEQRFLKLMDLQKFAAELQRAGQKARP